MRFFIVFLFVTLSSHAQVSNNDFLDFSKADSIALSYKGADLYNLYTFSNSLTKDLSTDFEKFRSIFYWVCTNITADRSANIKNQNNRRKLFKNEESLTEWNNNFSEKVFKTLLEDKKTVCTGYAYLLKKLCSISGIKCEIVDGYGRNALSVDLNVGSIPNHSWNAVQLDGKWYLCDPTWASGYFKGTEYTFNFEFNEGYFLTPPSNFILTHFPLKSQWQLLENFISFDDFIGLPLHYSFAFRNQIFIDSPLTINFQLKKNEFFTITMKVSEDVNPKEIVLKWGKELNYLKSDIVNLDANIVHITSKISVKGYYNIHVFYDGDIIASLNVRVKK
ncbi:transglutaminase domain-containing protein [Flammeovirga kamogawensis]|uniref:Transglutaminase-like domain-containing protein n=1 Tax=Flammeovirga kamogawensis TaxID=373891 RepID=A0ABX8GTK4_9BACT|nr:transglutaminase domain-containing protein [Flammeovirga kamogawensis]MBB6460106.1 transglutaminase/protease-like cytokinesis protein 3 [Flammeovirga kamogawensis]QWG06851.1 hypothetical protein KM029_16300 [Flammeovirga kamogawensis]TRX68673.1 hypothetical protein EO216_11295 [Flammeovirga kamogawensis]